MLARKTTLIIVNTVVGGILGLVALKVIALYMGAAVYGQLAFAIGLMGTVSFLTHLGFKKAHQKRVSEGRDLGDCVATFAAIGLVLAGAYMALVLLGLSLNRLVLGRPFVSTTETAVLIIAAFNASLIFRAIGATTFDARRETAKTQLAVLSEHLVMVPLHILFALFYASAKGRQGPIFDWLRDLSPGFAQLVFAHGADFLALAMLAAGVASAAVALWMLLRDYPVGRFDADLFKDYIKFALPVLAASIVGSVAAYIDKAALGFFWSDVVVGRFYGVQRLLKPMPVLMSSVATLIFPAISEHHGQGDREAIRRLVEDGMRYVSMVGVLIAFGAIALAEPGIRILLSNEWVPAAHVLRILAAAYVLNAIGMPMSQALYGANRPKTVTWISGGGALLSIGLVLVLVPRSLFGIPMGGLRGIGAAVAFLTARTLTSAITWVVCPIKPRSIILLRMAAHWLAGAGMAVVLWFVHTSLLPMERWFHAFFFMALGTGIYVALLALVGEFTRKDLDFFWAALHPGDMASYVKDEIRGDEE